MKKIFLLCLVLMLLKASAQRGGLDSSFGTNGYVKIGTTYDATAVQSDGKLIGVQKITGGFTITRYNTDGTIDGTFGTNGTVTTTIPYLTTPAKVLLAVQPGNDNIIVQEDGSSSYGAAYSYNTMGLARFTSNGNLDATFGTGGIVSVNTDVSYTFGSYPHISFLTTQSDGKIVTAVFYDGYRQSWVTVNRYNSNGSNDFGLPIQPNPYTRVYALAAGGDGKIALAITAEQQYSPYNTQSMIVTIASGVSQTVDIRSGYSPYSVLAIQNDGKVLAGLGAGLSRFSNDGTKDVSFGLNGTINTGLTVNQIVIDQNGRIGVAGGVNGDFALERSVDNGTPDPTFGANGRITTDFGGNEAIQNLEIGNNRMYAFGDGILAAYKLNNGCTPPTFFNNELIVKNASCNKVDGSILIKPASGTPPFLYSIDAGADFFTDPDDGYTFNNLAAGNYLLVLKDANGCQSEMVKKVLTTSFECIPTITTFSPTSGYVGSTVTISGTNFDPIATNNIVYFGAVKAAVTAATSSSLTVTVPAEATYLPLSVTVNNLIAYSNSPFLVTFPSSNTNISSTSFANKTDFATAGGNRSVLGDMDGDGKADMVILNSASISIFRNIGVNGTVAFAPRVDYPIVGSSFGVADLNGDGKLDVAVSTGSLVSVLINKSTIGAIFLAPPANFVLYGDDLTLADLNGDGKTDLAALTYNGPYGDGKVSVLRNTSINGSLSFASGVDFSPGQGSTALAVADLNGDQKPDIIISYWGGGVGIFKNTSTTLTPSFTSAGAYRGFSVIGKVITGDLDGDNKPELIGGTYNYSPGVAILRNISTGGTIAFTAQTSFRTLGSPRGGLAIGDFNGDGRPDLVLALSADTVQVPREAIGILQNSSIIGNISFNSPIYYQYVNTPNGIAVGDVDGDNKPDLITGIADNTISVLRNMMSSACTPPTFVNNGMIVLNASCANNDGNITIAPTSGTAPFMYSINGGATYVSGADYGYTFGNLASGTYQLRLKDANGCESAIVERVVALNCTTTVTCTPPTFLNNGMIVLNASCANNDGNITIAPTSGTAPFMYSINGGATYVSGADYGYTFGNLASGTYQLRLKDANGCESAIVERVVALNCTTTVTCTPPTFLNNGMIVLNASCANNDGNITIAPTSGTAPFMYSINGGTTYVSGADYGYTFGSLASGTYQLRLKDAKGCESSVVERAVLLNCTNTCTPPTFLNNGMIVLNASCANNDGNITIQPTSGTGPFMYSINGGTTYVLGADYGYTFGNLASGTYQLRLKDANGCESAIVERVVALNCTTTVACTPPTFLNNVMIVLNASCANNDGNITIAPTSGTAPFMYSINGGATYVSGADYGYTFGNLASGTYQLRLKDANGCESAIVERVVALNCTTTVACTPPTFLNNVMIVLNASCANNDGNITIAPTSGTAPFMYSINGGATYVSGADYGYTFGNLASGTYQLRLKDARGCESAVVAKSISIVYGTPCGQTAAAPAVTALGMALPTEAVSAYPNPTNGQFKLQLKGFTSHKSEVSIFNGEGKTVQKRQLNLAGTNTLDFDLRGQAKGMYYIKITSNNGTRTSKILVQ